jgi:hypothetical protein
VAVLEGGGAAAHPVVEPEGIVLPLDRPLGGDAGVEVGARVERLPVRPFDHRALHREEDVAGLHGVPDAAGELHALPRRTEWRLPARRRLRERSHAVARVGRDGRRRGRGGRVRGGCGEERL